MAELSPIQPLLYAPDAVGGDLSQVITPPYDVLSPAEQAEYRRNPYSAIHIELPVAEAGVDPYAAAAALADSWRRDGVLRPHPNPALFVHAQEFVGADPRARPRTRTALLAGVRLEPWEADIVIPHERTFAGPKRDRLQLLRATALAPSSLFGLYEQPHAVREAIQAATTGEPLRRAAEGGVTHKLWAIDDPEQVRAVAEAMSAEPIYIADGHHRYETALAYRDERRATGTGPSYVGEAGSPVGLAADGSDEAAYNYVAMSLVAFDDPGLVVLPTHRLVFGVGEERVRRLPEILDSVLELRPVGEYPRTERGVQALLEGDEPYAFLLYDGETLWRAAGGAGVPGELPQDRSPAWRQLDLAALHELVIGRALGVAADETYEHVRYTRDVPGAFAQVDQGEAQLACFVRPTGVRQLRAVADARDLMPQKSTFFYPKFPAGLVINQLDVALPRLSEVAR